MKKIRLEIVEKSIVIEPTFGSLYFVFTSMPSSEITFQNQNEKITFVNSLVKMGVKIPKYLERNPISKTKINELKDNFNIPFLIIDESRYFDQLVYVMLKELENSNISVVETTGLANDSIRYLIKFCQKFLDLNPHKLIIIVDLQKIRNRYPYFLLEKIDSFKIEIFYKWYESHNLDNIAD